MKRFVLLLSILVPAVVFAQAAVPGGSTLVTPTSTRLDASSCQSASGTAQQTITIPAAVGQYAYITFIGSSAWATTAPAASSITTTSTNLGATPLMAFGLTATNGVSGYATITPATPIKSVLANTATTIVSNAAVTSVTFGLTVCYYMAP